MAKRKKKPQQTFETEKKIPPEEWEIWMPIEVFQGGRVAVRAPEEKKKKPK